MLQFLPARYIPNLGFEAVARSSTALLGPDIQAAAEKIAEAARNVAPVATGAYRDSIGAAVGLDGEGVVGSAYADVDYAGYVEFGTSDTPAFAPLRRGADASGFRSSGGGG